MMANFGTFCNQQKIGNESFAEYMKLVKHYRTIRGNFNRKKCHRHGMDIHHIVPKYLGGSNHPRNYVYVYPDEHMILHNMLDVALRNLKVKHSKQKKVNHWIKCNSTYRPISIFSAKVNGSLRIKLLTYNTSKDQNNEH